MAIRILIIKDSFSARNGSTKLTLDIAKALGSVGADVDVVFFHSDGSEHILGDELVGVKSEILENRLLFWISKVIQYPIIKLYLKDAFTTGDAVNILDQLRLARRLNRSASKYDLLISMNMWTSIPSLFLSPYYRTHSVLFFHEPPVFGGLPRPITLFMEIFLRLILRNTWINLSLTEPMKKDIQVSAGIKTTVVADAFSVRPVTSKKEDYVLLDTRWTFVRNPFFALDIAERLPDVKFLMCGKFGSESLKQRFLTMVEERKMADRFTVREENTEAELNSFYAKAKCYIRWSNPSIIERGPSYGLIQAVSNGCIPILSEDMGSSGDVAEHLGADFVVANNPADFARAIGALYKDENFSARAFEKVIQWRNSYTGKEYGKRLLSVVNLAPSD